MGIILPLAMVLVYSYLGYKLNKNFILWGLMGLGILIAPLLLVVLATRLSTNPGFMLGFWPIASITGPLISIVVIGWVAFKNSAVFKKSS
jgi:hypothetical protein